MKEILAMASAIGLVTSGVVQAIKHTDRISKTYLPIVAVLIGIVIGALASFIDIGLIERLWAGGVSGLMAVGLYEAVKEED